MRLRDRRRSQHLSAVAIAASEASVQRTALQALTCEGRLLVNVLSDISLLSRNGTQVIVSYSALPQVYGWMGGCGRASRHAH